MIDWTSLVKQQSCVEWVHIIDKQTGLSKDFWTPRNDVNMPIEYAKTTCEMNIFIYGHEKCYSVNTKVPCKKEETKEEEKTATFETIGIVCAVVFPIAVLVLIVTFVVQKKDWRQNSEQKQELNDQYGRYYQVMSKMHLLLKLVLQPIFPPDNEKRTTRETSITPPSTTIQGTTRMVESAMPRSLIRTSTTSLMRAMTTT